MNKKNNLWKSLMGLALLLTSFGLQSCDLFSNDDNPVILNIVETVTENTGASAEEVTALIKEALSTDAVQQAISSGQPIKVTIAGGSTTSSTNQTITIPATVTGGVEIELTFTEAITSSEAYPLVIKGEGVSSSTTSGDSSSELTISMPTATGLVVAIDLPTTTVVLKTTGTGTVYKSIAAKTAKNTLVVEKDVTIEELQIKGGTVMVMDGGKVETLAANSDGILIDNNGATFIDASQGGENYAYLITNANQEPYYCSQLKILPPEGGIGEYGTESFNPCFIKGKCDSDHLIEKLTIADGAAVVFDGEAYNTPSMNNYQEGDGPHIKLVEGEGDGTGIIPLPNESFIWYGYIREIKNVTIVNSGGDDAVFGIYDFSYEDCTFTGFHKIDVWTLSPNYFNGLTFNSECWTITTRLPEQQTTTFEGCNFNSGQFNGICFWGYAEGTGPQNARVISLVFKDCKYKGSPVVDFDSDFFNELISKLGSDTNPDNAADLTGKVTFNFTINNVTKSYGLTTFDAENHRYNVVEQVE